MPVRASHGLFDIDPYEGRKAGGAAEPELKRVQQELAQGRFANPPAAYAGSKGPSNAGSMLATSHGLFDTDPYEGGEAGGGAEPELKPVQPELAQGLFTNAPAEYEGSRGLRHAASMPAASRALFDINPYEGRVPSRRAQQLACSSQQHASDRDRAGCT